jgi:hypothetical protein
LLRGGVPAAAVVWCVVLAVLAAIAAYSSGGYFPKDYLALGAAACVAAGVGVATAGAGWRPPAAGAVALGYLVALAAWTALSSAWSPDPPGATLAAARTLGYAGVLLLALLALGRDGRHARLLLRLVVGVLLAVGAAALLSRLLPGAVPGGSDLGFSTQGRLGSVITYANGLGCVTAMAVLGAIGLAAEPSERISVRVAAVAAAVLCVAAMYLTLSRGTAFALAAAVVVVLALSPHRLRLSIVTVLVLAAGAVAVLVLRTQPVLVDLPATDAQRASAGHQVLWQVLLVAAVAAAALTALARLPVMRSRRRAAHDVGAPRLDASVWRPPPGVLRTALPFVPLVVGILVVVGAYAAVGDRLEGRTNTRTSSVRSYVDRQVNAFLNPVPTDDLSGQARLGSAQSSRSDAYRVALRGLAANPLVGDGAAGYEARWYLERRGPESIRDAHSLELETLSDLGAVGGALLAGFLAMLLLGMRSVITRTGVLRRTEAAGAAGVVLVWTMHSAVDWDWQLAGVTIPALACGAALMAGTASPRRRRRRGGHGSPMGPGTSRGTGTAAS